MTALFFSLFILCAFASVACDAVNVYNFYMMQSTNESEAVWRRRSRVLGIIAYVLGFLVLVSFTEVL